MIKPIKDPCPDRPGGRFFLNRGTRKLAVSSPCKETRLRLSGDRKEARMANTGTNIKGWLGTYWGMNEVEMLGALQDYPVRETERQQYDGQYSRHIVEGVQIGSFAFEAILQMKNDTGALSRVVLRHSLPLGEPQNDVIKAVFNALSSEFGSPVMLDKPTHFQWRLKFTDILLHTIDLPSSLNLVSVIYTPTGTQ